MGVRRRLLAAATSGRVSLEGARGILAFGAVIVTLTLSIPVGPAAASRAPGPGLLIGSGSAGPAQVVGVVVGLDGAPAAGVPITIVETDTGTDAVRPTRTVATMNSGPDGGYMGELASAYIPGTETDADWIVRASRPAGPGEAAGAISSFEFEVNTAIQEAPDLPLWDSTTVVSVDGYRVEVSVPDVRPSGASSPMVFFNWASKPGTAAVFDLRAAEPDRLFFGSERLVTGGSSSATSPSGTPRDARSTTRASARRRWR